MAKSLNLTDTERAELIRLAGLGLRWARIAGGVGWTARQLTAKCQREPTLHSAILKALTEHSETLAIAAQGRVARGDTATILQQLHRDDNYPLPSVDQSNPTDKFMDNV